MVGKSACSEDTALDVALFEIIDMTVGMAVDTVVEDTVELTGAILAYEVLPGVEISVACPELGREARFAICVDVFEQRCLFRFEEGFLPALVETVADAEFSVFAGAFGGDEDNTAGSNVGEISGEELSQEGVMKAIAGGAK